LTKHRKGCKLNLQLKKLGGVILEKRKDIYEWVGRTDLGYKIATEKYFQKNETVDQFCERVGGGNEEVTKLIKDKKVIFGGRIMANRGIENGMSFSNCATAAYVKDSIKEIGELQTDLMKMYQAGQGVGLCLSNIRPKGALAGKGGNTTAGIVPFAKIFDNATENTIAGSTGRRGR
jgi:ribonucleoside-diphosphate reductase alpha chain